MCVGIQLEGGGRKGEGLFQEGLKKKQSISLSQRFKHNLKCQYMPASNSIW